MNRPIRVLVIAAGMGAAVAAAAAVGFVPGLMGDTCCPPPASADAPVAAASSLYDKAMTAGCQKACAHQGEVPEGDIVAQPGAGVGDLVRCPVSGVVFEIKEAQPSVEVNGETHYTCCASCAQRAAAG